MPATPVETDEYAVKGESIYHRNVLPRLGEDDRGKYVSIDIDSGLFEVDEDELAALHRLRKQAPLARVWFRRVGFPCIHRFGPRRVEDSE